MKRRKSGSGWHLPGWVLQLETGQIEPRDFVDQFCRLIDLRADYDQFCEIWSCIFTGTLVPESMLEGLARRYRLVLVSNTNAIHFEMIQRSYPLLRHFHDLVLSHEVGAAKPDPRIYQVALEKAGCRPGECFYTDDIPEFVDGCEGFGDRFSAVRVGRADRAGDAGAGDRLGIKNRAFLWKRPVSAHL